MAAKNKLTLLYYTWYWRNRLHTRFISKTSWHSGAGQEGGFLRWPQWTMQVLAGRCDPAGKARRNELVINTILSKHHVQPQEEWWVQRRPALCSRTNSPRRYRRQTWASNWSQSLNRWIASSGDVWNVETTKVDQLSPKKRNELSVNLH